MSPRPKNAPKARLTLCAPRSPRLRSTSFRPSATSSGLPGAGVASPTVVDDAPGSTDGLAVGPAPLGAAGAGLTTPALDGGGFSLPLLVAGGLLERPPPFAWLRFGTGD